MYITRRIIRSALLLLGISFVCFAVMEMAPGDYFDEMLLNPSISPQTVAQLRDKYGLNKPMITRYLHWCRAVLRGDWGMSIAYQRAAGPILRDRVRNTLILSGVSTGAAWLIGVGAATWAAAGRGWRRKLIVSLTAFLAPVPDLVLILGLMFVSSQTLRLPAGGMTSSDPVALSVADNIRDHLLHIVLPSTALVLALLPIVLLHADSAISEVVNQPFVTSARATGISGYRLLVRHILPVASNPLISLGGFSIGAMLSSGLVIEAVTGWPGLGSLLLNSILRRDSYVVLGAVVISAAFLLTATLIADLLLFIADPRTRRR